ncbi:GH25 family lysozyme [Clostridium omnivorum]|uniref:Autolytic lysozyme n=1 Tax=Clostridium omnivorum TaxID=1604902 RepID=A0ABQ5NCK6_9CLOT|nr:GH25 family lysozyme [Clostridium sp. E14]GLC32929.1 autolytic lysozyme [Clostridium sp. E14]
MKGIDISSYQQNVDFNQVKNNGVEIVILKASEGKTWQDPTFKDKYNNAKAAGLKVGAYHFLRGNAPQDEASNFLNMIEGLSLDCKLIIDAEVDLGGIETTSNQVKAVKDILVSKGYDVALYSGEYFYNTNLNNSVKDIPLWVAKYSNNKPNVSSYIGWQYSDVGNVPGINGYVDINEFLEGILLTNNCSNGTCNITTPTKETWEFYISGDLVKRLQHELNIQYGFKLDEDGYLGDKSLNALESVAIKHDAKGNITRIIQERLLQLGYKLPRYGADSDFGDETANALYKFQLDRKLIPDMVAGINTFKELFRK